MTKHQRVLSKFVGASDPSHTRSILIIDAITLTKRAKAIAPKSTHSNSSSMALAQAIKELETALAWSGQSK